MGMPMTFSLPFSFGKTAGGGCGLTVVALRQVHLLWLLHAIAGLRGPRTQIRDTIQRVAGQYLSSGLKTLWAHDVPWLREATFGGREAMRRLSREGRGSTGDSRCLSRKARKSTRDRRCLSRRSRGSTRGRRPHQHLLQPSGQKVPDLLRARPERLLLALRPQHRRLLGLDLPVLRPD